MALFKESLEQIANSYDIVLLDTCALRMQHRAVKNRAILSRIFGRRCTASLPRKFANEYFFQLRDVVKRHRNIRTIVQVLHEMKNGLENVPASTRKNPYFSAVQSVYDHLEMRNAEEERQYRNRKQAGPSAELVIFMKLYEAAKHLLYSLPEAREKNPSTTDRTLVARLIAESARGRAALVTNDAGILDASAHLFHYLKAIPAQDALKFFGSTQSQEQIARADAIHPEVTCYDLLNEPGFFTALYKEEFYPANDCGRHPDWKHLPGRRQS